jgi:hypothetical protein
MSGLAHSKRRVLTRRLSPRSLVAVATEVAASSVSITAITAVIAVTTFATTAVVTIPTWAVATVSAITITITIAIAIEARITTTSTAILPHRALTRTATCHHRTVIASAVTVIPLTTIFRYFVPPFDSQGQDNSTVKYQSDHQNYRVKQGRKDVAERPTSPGDENTGHHDQAEWGQNEQ